MLRKEISWASKIYENHTPPPTKKEKLLQWEAETLPPIHCGIKGEWNQKLPRILLISLHPQSFLLHIHIVSNGDRLLVLNIGWRLRHQWATRIPAAHPIRVVGRAAAMMVVIVWSRQRHWNRWRRRRVISRVLLVVRWRVSVGISMGILSGVRCRRRKDEPVRRDLGLRRRGRRRRRVAPPASLPPAAADSDVTHD